MAEEKQQLSVILKQQLVDNLELVQGALPSDFNRTRFVQNCMALLNDNPELAKKGTLLIPGMLKASYLGLDFLNKECYLIPYGNAVNFQTSYIGEIKFTKKYSTRKIKDIYAKVVRQGDEFVEKVNDGVPSIDYLPLPFNDGNIVGAFALCLFEDGGMIYETMSIKEIQDVRHNYSKAKDSGAWKNESTFPEMCKKTVLRRLCKHIDTDFDSAEARQIWEETSPATFKKETSDIVADPFSDAIEVDAVEVTNEDVTAPPDDFELPFN